MIKRPSSKTSPKLGAARWGGAVFCVVTLLGAVGIKLCQQTLCGAHLSGWAFAPFKGLLLLAAPWMLLLPSMMKLTGTGWAASLPLAAGAGCSAGLLTFLARYWYLRFRRFLATPMPEDWAPDATDEALLPGAAGRGRWTLAKRS